MISYLDPASAFLPPQVLSDRIGHRLFNVAVEFGMKAIVLVVPEFSAEATSKPPICSK
jgi:hypothetical protein